MTRNLPQWLAYLEQLHPSTIDMGLQRVAEVAARLHVDRPAPLVITVTGTNGKGSTCAALEALLLACGRRVGCYSSPHLLQYNERVRIAGQMVADADLCQAFAAVEQARAEISLTYFEFGTLAALWLFSQAGLDVVVLEVGLGGRLDAVNVVDADLAILTSVGLDHQEYLGTTRESVAFEKAGILRPGIAVVCGETDLPSTFVARVDELGCRLLQRGVSCDWQALDGQGWQVRLCSLQAESVSLSLPDVSLPRNNLLLALQALHWLALLPSAEACAATLGTLRMPGRMDRRWLHRDGKSRQLCLDVGHNPHAAAYLAAQLAERPQSRCAVFGVLADKDLDGILDQLKGSFEHWYLAAPDCPRALPGEQLLTAVQQHGCAATLAATLPQALEQALASVDEKTEVLVFGSFFTVAECLQYLQSSDWRMHD